MSVINKIDKKYLIAGSIGILLLVIFLVFNTASASYDTAKAEVMPFNIEVSAEGEIQALEFERIMIPEILAKRKLRIWQLKISDLVAEGTKVKKGDFIAKLDPTQVMELLKSSNDRVEEYTNSMESARLDSTITLMQKREQLTNTKDDLEECKIKVEQSRFESKATQRQAHITLEKANLNINTQTRNYEKEVLRERVKIKRIQKRLDYELHKKEMLEELRKQLMITSPSSGMVVYGKSWSGRKIKVNDDVGPWSPLIAIIPDLSTLISETIVKEIDIAKIKVGQKVKVVVDAFPEDIFDGEILKIANIGQPIKGAGMNGFKVVIDIDVKGKKILPSMTTSNNILISTYVDDVVVPREAVFGDVSNQYVFKKQGTGAVKTTIEIGGENETHIRIVQGLKDGDEVLLTRPDEITEKSS